MSKSERLYSERLILRQWQELDRAIFAHINADPDVMAYFPTTLSQQESNQLLDRLAHHIAEKGWGLWALEQIDSAHLVGFVGLQEVNDALPFSPAVEIGWRLAREYWGQGFATEAAKRVLTFAFEELELNEIVSFTSIHNTRSRAVMERLGMLDSHNDFDHPALPQGHYLQSHALYRLTRDRWRQEN
ncbi:MAG: GNAT family N-acetyltransferase [Gammaproteobacteria bacterium]|nr:GNAT family N-acetyltransferase [Gammaproteobacteria bacterium]